MKKVNQKYVLIIDDDAFYKTNLWNNYTENSNIDGLFYLDYKKNNNYKGEIVWSNNKPVVSCRDLLWGDLEDSNQLIENINSRTNTDNIDITKEDAYTFVYLHVWSNDMNILQNVVTELNKNPKVRIITPDVFIKLIKDNINPK